MSTAFDILEKSLDDFCQKNPAWNQYIEVFKNASSTLTLDQLLAYDCGACNELTNFKLLWVFLQYHNEAPKGENYASLSIRFLSLFETLKTESERSVIPFITLLYCGALAKEIQDLDKLSMFNPWLKVYEDLSGFQNINKENPDISSFAESLALQISFRSWDFIGLEIDEDKPEDITSIIDTLYIAQNLNLDVNSTITSFFNHVQTSFAEKYKIYFPKDESQPNSNFEFPARVVKKLKNLKFDDQTILEQLAALEEFFGGFVEGFVEDEQGNNDPLFVRPADLPYGQIDFNSIFYQKTIYVNVSNPKVSVNIYHYKDQNNKDIAIKEYSATSSADDLVKVKAEVDILEFLSKYATRESAFLKFNGSSWHNLRVFLSMEYHPKTLMQEISEMKRNAKTFTEDHIKFYASILCDAFSIMEQLGIYHQDIKPHNILMTEEGFLKIIDFSIAFIKTSAEATIAATGVYLIQGTSGYMAPELEDSVRTPERKANFRRNKADVFSLGITLLQMYTLEELHTLNLSENHKRLMEKVDKINLSWLRTLLSKMLKLNYNDRPSFKETLQYIPGSKQTTII